MEPQAGILEPVPAVGRHLTFDLRFAADPHRAIRKLADEAPPSCVIGLGLSLVSALGATIDGLRVFPALAGKGVETPSTQNALWVWVRESALSDCFRRVPLDREGVWVKTFALVEEISTFVYRKGRDLSGYEDGTENPKDDAAREAAIVASGPLQGSSFAAVQRWVHDLRQFMSLDACFIAITRSAGDSKTIRRYPTHPLPHMSDAQHRKVSIRPPSCCGDPCRGASRDSTACTFWPSENRWTGLNAYCTEWSGSKMGSWMDSSPSHDPSQAATSGVLHNEADGSSFRRWASSPHSL